jgi:hypothetical protein
MEELQHVTLDTTSTALAASYGMTAMVVNIHWNT